MFRNAAKPIAVSVDESQQTNRLMGTDVPKKLDRKLECANCHTIYLTITQALTPSSLIHCSSCGGSLGTWAELEADFIAQGGDHGIFEMHNGQIFRRD